MVVDVKLRNLKTTIISNVIGIISFLSIMPAVANSFGVSLKKENGKMVYFIETKLDTINRSRDSRVAPIYAKSQLLKYLKNKHSFASVDLKHFTLLKVEKHNGYSVFIFKVNKSNVVFKELAADK
ncbi:hypothetical protein RO21_00985 [[Actinobacillus] muris]|uniref:Uncharacterized protein n=3 Tax=Muribacter muris TaxID=67855 RepID=A0A0J5P895_9PAST|nr:hypothetical protein RO21_00985 [[Actinobacillus] muris] [Muribacter muris]